MLEGSAHQLLTSRKNNCEILLSIIEDKLKNTQYKKTQGLFVDIPVITLYWNENILILDIVTDDDECALTLMKKHRGTSFSYSFFDDDVVEVAHTISSKILECLDVARI